MKLIQINIEQDKHIPKVRDFLLKENPDAVCMQEVFDTDFEEFKTFLSMDGIYVPMLKREDKMQGSAIFSKTPITDHKIEYYYKAKEGTFELKRGEKLWNRKYSLITIETEYEEHKYQITTTHFPVNYPGSIVSDFQKDCFKIMNEFLRSRDELILCADTNCPRGTEIFDTLAKQYKDNIPQNITTTIDGNLHKAGPQPYVVDCLFTSPHYLAENVRLVDGMSDHIAIVADISKISKP